MPGHNPLMGAPAYAGPTLLGPGQADASSMAGHPLITGPAVSADERAISRTAAVIVLAAIAVVVAVHAGGFRSTITIGA